MFQFTKRSKSRSQRKSSRKPRELRLESLEVRSMMTASPLVDLPAEAADDPSAATFDLSHVPVLNSNPGARKSLHLDFDGHRERLRTGNWLLGDNIKNTDTRGAFSIDDDHYSFTQVELDSIADIWDRVAEDFAPFNVNVTTIEPSAQRFSDGDAVRIVIGGRSTFWYQSPDDDPAWGVHLHGHDQIAFVFSDDIVDAACDGRCVTWLESAVAGTISHEAGHAYGLAHQEFYNSDGSQPEQVTFGSISQSAHQASPWDRTLVDFNPEYNPGQRGGPGSEIESDWAPLMGGGSDKRDTWHYGPTSSATRYQDDMAVLAAKLGYRADDHGASLAEATWVPTVNNSIVAHGIIERTSDADHFVFYHGGGQVNLSVQVNSQGANLDARMELRDDRGRLLAQSDPSSSLDATISSNLPKGTYHVVVRSHGAYGDVGQYTLLGTGVSSVGYTTTGPRVLRTSVANPNVDPFTRGPVTMLVTFDKPINATTFSTGDVSFIAPNGQRITAYRVEAVPGRHGGRTFKIQAHLPLSGTYRIEIGPEVRDLYGNRMDQDRDGIQGESRQDRYSNTAITRQLPTLYNISRAVNRSGYGGMF